MWKTMHSVAFTYAADPDNPTPEEQKAALDFFGSLGLLIPCTACGKHYASYLERNPVDVSSRKALSEWVYKLHSDVNRRKHVENPSFDEVKKMYTEYEPEDGGRIPTPKTMERKMKQLADPHFGKPIVFDESLMGSLPSGANAAMMGMLVFGGLIAGGVYFLGKKAEQDDKKENNKNNQQQ